MKIMRLPGSSGNMLVTNAVGDGYYEAWERWAWPTWEKYAERYDLGVAVLTTDPETQPRASKKKPYWSKLLIGDVLERSLPGVRNACFLDTDTLINPTAPNVFDFYFDEESIGLVSEKRRLPYPLEDVLRRIAFLRHTYLDERYPLDSYLFATIDQIFDLHGLPRQTDFACTGFFVFSVRNHAGLMKQWYERYAPGVDTMDGGTEEVHLNFEIQSRGKVTWFDYRFQALWMYEMAWKYPFLYYWGRDDHRLIRECIEASLFTNYFLHFAGSWEGDMWKQDGILEGDASQRRFEDFAKYAGMPVTGLPKGIIKPRKLK